MRLAGLQTPLNVSVAHHLTFGFSISCLSHSLHFSFWMQHMSRFCFALAGGEVLVLLDVASGAKSGSSSRLLAFHTIPLPSHGLMMKWAREFILLSDNFLTTKRSVYRTTALQKYWCNLKVYCLLEFISLSAFFSEAEQTQVLQCF